MTSRASKPQSSISRPKTFKKKLDNLPANARSTLLDNAIEQYGAGRSVYEIAKEIGVEHTTLYRQLIKHKEGEWREAKISKALIDVEQAEENVRTALDALALSRAREQFRIASWHLERLWRKMYGQDAPSSVAAVQVNINLRRNALDVVAGQEDAPSEPL